MVEACSGMFADIPMPDGLSQHVESDVFGNVPGGQKFLSLKQRKQFTRKGQRIQLRLVGIIRFGRELHPQINFLGRLTDNGNLFGHVRPLGLAIGNLGNQTF